MCVGIDVIDVCLFIDYTKKDNFSFVCHDFTPTTYVATMWCVGNPAIQQLVVAWVATVPLVVSLALASGPTIFLCAFWRLSGILAFQHNGRWWCESEWC